MKTFFRSQPHHPDHQVVRQDAALEDGGISPKGAGADGAGSHLRLAPGDPIFTGGSSPENTPLTGETPVKGVI